MTEMLAEFLLARYDEAANMQRAGTAPCHEMDCGYVQMEHGVGCKCGGDALWVADLEAKRRIVAGMGATADIEGGGYEIAHSETLRYLAQPYADHPGFRDEWRLPE